MYSQVSIKQAGGVKRAGYYIRMQKLKKLLGNKEMIFKNAKIAGSLNKDMRVRGFRKI